MTDKPKAPVACYLCGNADEKKFEFITDKFRYDYKKTAFRCLACGLIFIVPRMSAEEERVFYEKEYGEIYSAEKGTTPKDLFQNRLPDARRYRELSERHLAKNDDCLEIGCASGYFLDVIRPLVRSITGYETHNLLRAYLKEIDIGVLESLDACPPARFDKVFLFFVLEHLGDPMPYLHNLKRITRPGGKIFIEVPNVDDVLVSGYKIPALRDFYFTPAHQYYYSKDTLSALLRKAGFNRFAIEPEQRYDLSNHMHWMMTGKPGGQGKYNHLFSPQVLSAYAAALKEKWLCDTLFAVVDV